MDNNSLHIILDNIDVIKNRKRITSYYAMSKQSSIKATTISSWYSKNRRKPVYPRLKTLDLLCDCLQTHTSDLFIPQSQFTHEYTVPNDSMSRFRINFKSICIENGYTSVKSQIELFTNEWTEFDRAKERYYSYFRLVNGRAIPIDQLDILANKLNIPTYKLLL